ncbi:MAG: site-2 protease family protein, partial [Acidobacteriia bacterium]|nr:site-2 protease family protein [Terriglobia bacterium]
MHRSTATGERWWLHGLLLLLTLVTTTEMGARLALNYQANLPAFSEEDLDAFLRLIRNPDLLWQGLPFSLTLLTILMAHELGHYFACLHYRIDASPPYFLPAPTLIGTLGAFIRIRSPIYTRHILFDVGIAGPLAGFLFVLPALAIGLAYSKVIPGIAVEGDLVFGIPLMQRAMEAIIFPGVHSADIYLHPVA